VRHPAETLARPHAAETTQRYLSYTLDVAIADDGRHAWSGHHRPPTEPSPRRQTCLDPTDKFPEPDTPEPHRARHPDHAESNPTGRLEHPEHAWRSSTHACAPAPLRTQACTALHAEADTTIAPHRRAHT
jgi:hypothetical protein